MNRLRATNSVASASRDIAPTTGTPQYATNGVPGSVPATEDPAYFQNMVIDELCAIPLAGGGTLDDVQSAGSWNQVWQYLFRSHTFADTGSVNALAVALPSGLSFPSGAVGLGTCVRVKIANTNTGAATLALFGLSAAAIHQGGAALVGGELQANGIAELVGDGSGNYELLACSKPAAGQSFNSQEFTTSTRVSMSGSSGNGYLVTAWSPGNFNKRSSTSTLKIECTAPTFTPSSPGSGCANAVLNIGSAHLNRICSNNVAATSNGETIIFGTLTGLPAGALAVTLQYYVNTATNWTTIFCPTNSDEAYFDATTQAQLTITEIGP